MLIAVIPLINVQADVSCEAGSLKFLHPYFLYASIEDSDESVHMRRLEA